MIKFNFIIFGLIFLTFITQLFGEHLSYTDKKKQLDSLEQAIEEQKNKIDQLALKNNALSGQLALQTEKIHLSEKYFQEITKHLSMLEIRLDTLSSLTMTQKNRKITLQERMAQILPVYYSSLKQEKKLLLVPDQNLLQIVRQSIYFKSLSLYQFYLIQELKDTLQQINDQVRELKYNQQELISLREKQKHTAKNLMEEQKRLRESIIRITEQKELLTQYYEEQLQDRQLIQDWLKNFETARQERINPLKVLQYDFNSLKGKLRWPIKGKIITSFGEKRDKQFNTQTFMNGIEIEPLVSESPINPVAPGIIRFADWHRSYGKFIIIEHSQGYYSVYGYLSQIAVNVGQTVTEQMVIGNIGKNILDQKIKLFLALYQSMTNLNPADWLSQP